MNALLYSRITNKSQYLSLISQRDVLSKYVKNNKIIEIESYSDIGKSGCGMKELIRVAKPKDIVLVRDVNAIHNNYESARKIVDTLHEKNSYIFCVNNHITSDNKYFPNLLLFNHVIKNQYTLAKKQSVELLKENGNYFGKEAPYGYRIAKRGIINVLEKDTEEQFTIFYIKNLANRGFSYLDILEKMKGFVEGKRGKEWSIALIKEIEETEFDERSE